MLLADAWCLNVCALGISECARQRDDFERDAYAQAFKVWAVRTGPRAELYMLLQAGDWSTGDVWLAGEARPGEPAFVVKVRLAKVSARVIAPHIVHISGCETPAVHHALQSSICVRSCTASAALRSNCPLVCAAGWRPLPARLRVRGPSDAVHYRVDRASGRVRERDTSAG